MALQNEAFLVLGLQIIHYLCFALHFCNSLFSRVVNLKVPCTDYRLTGGSAWQHYRVNRLFAKQVDLLKAAQVFFHNNQIKSYEENKLNGLEK